MRSLRAWLERPIGDGAFLGAGGAFLTLLSYWWAARWQPTWVPLPERILLTVMGSGLGIVFEPLDLLVLRSGYLWLPILAALVAWRRTRPLVAVVLGAVLLIESARLAALACFSVYLMDPWLGLLSVPCALLPALFLTRWRRWPILSTVMLAFGLGVGVALGVVFQHDFPAVVSPLDRFVPIALASLLIAWLISTRTEAARSAGIGRFVRMWGLLAICVSCILIIVITTDRFRPRSAPPHRFLAESSYDVHMTGEPAELVWTDTVQSHVLTNPYGESHGGYVLAAGDHRCPQRIWASPTDGIYIQMLKSVGWWKAPPSGEQFSQDSAVEYRNDLLEDGSPQAFAEDPVTRRVFMMSQWGSHYVVMDRDTGITRATGRLSTAFLGGWHSLPVLPSRRAYISSALEDGGLYELNLDSMETTRKAAGLYLYETVLDPENHMLWGARPLTGEVIGVDSETFTVVSRIRTGFGSRDLQRDPGTGILYTCSLFGDVFRVDPASRTAARIAWCGRLCRNLFLDVARETLWAATDDGICRIPLPVGETAHESRPMTENNLVSRLEKW